MFTQTTLRSFYALLTLAILTGTTSALPVKVVHIDTPQCDPLFIPSEGVHEIGDVGVFPSDEALFATDQGPSNFIPCPPMNDTTLPDPVVEMRNLSGRDWLEVWYVANRDTTITNFDGEANDSLSAPVHEAFRIDNDASDPGGSHHPLIFESLTPDGIWEIGEVWRFVLQDYSNTLGLPPSALDSLGVGDASSPSAAGTVSSSGSIIAIPIPEPSTCLLVAIAFGVVILRRT